MGGGGGKPKTPQKFTSKNKKQTKKEEGRKMKRY
jgi:hypothetical protein